MPISKTMTLIPIYAVNGVDGVITIRGTNYSLRVIDVSAGISVGGGPIEVETFRPAATCMAADVISLNLSFDDLDQSTLLMNLKSYRIASVKPRPSALGENDGELYLFLEEL